MPSFQGEGPLRGGGPSRPGGPPCAGRAGARGGPAVREGAGRAGRCPKRVMRGRLIQGLAAPVRPPRVSFVTEEGDGPLSLRPSTPPAPARPGGLQAPHRAPTGAARSAGAARSGRPERTRAGPGGSPTGPGFPPPALVRTGGRGRKARARPPLPLVGEGAGPRGRPLRDLLPVPLTRPGPRGPSQPEAGPRAPDYNSQTAPRSCAHADWLAGPSASQPAAGRRPRGARRPITGARRRPRRQPTQVGHHSAAGPVRSGFLGPHG